jgi:hypothetical protein
VNPQITLVGVAHGAIGYGRAAVELSKALKAQGVEVYDQFAGDGSQVPYLRMPAGESPGKTNVSCWLTFPSHARGWLEGQRALCLTMFETDELPEAFRENLEAFDQIIVPSVQNQEMFSRLHPNVAYVPLGIDPQTWHYIPRMEDRFFWFMVAGAGARKGPDLAVRAFRKVFPNPQELDPVPQLIVKSPRADDEVNGVWLAGPNISVLSGRCSADEEVDLYASVHCYLGPSRGEGFGLQPLQAMAQGIPTILTNAHGHESFAHLGIPIGSTKVPAGYFSLAGEGRAGQWWEPDFDELCETMWMVYADYDAQLLRAQFNAEEISREWTWARTAERFIDAVGLEHMTVPYSGSGVWHEPEVRLYPVQVQRPYSGMAAGIQMQMTPGETYWEPADVKRQLFESGYLDVSCLDSTAAEPGMFGDVGLTEEQVAKIGGYRAEHSYCWSCGQKLGSGVTKGDELYESYQREHDAE